MSTVENEEKGPPVFFHHFSLDVPGIPVRFGQNPVQGRATAAYTLDENREADVRRIEFALAFCSPTDNFNKKLGRNKSSGRLKSNRFKLSAELVVDKNKPFTSQVCQLLETAAKAELPMKWR